ncbi:hypothetical protein Trydic_g9771 [Trypoxylus dichotomus]
METMGKTTTRIRNSAHFIEKVKDVKVAKNDVVVSLDIKSQFTNIPTEEAVNTIRQRLQELNMEGGTTDLTELCAFSTANSHHHPTQERGIRKTLAQIAKTILDVEKLEAEAQHIKNALKQNVNRPKDVMDTNNQQQLLEPTAIRQRIHGQNRKENYADSIEVIFKAPVRTIY